MKYARLELERRWLVPEPPPGWSPDGPHRLVEDRYLEGSHLRLRRMTTVPGGEVTRKLGQKLAVEGQGGTHRQMTTLYLTPEEYRLLAGLPARCFSKRRYSLDGLSLDLLPDGRMLAEKEFQDETTMAAFEPPGWVGPEVTEVADFTGGELAFIFSQDRGNLGETPL